MDLKQFNPLKVLNHWQTLNDIISGENPYPISCEIDPSNLCNHNCVWCINDKFRKFNRVFIPPALMFRIIREMARCKVKSVAFTGGGEPFMNPATLGAIQLTHKHKMDAGLVTNGELLDPEKCQIIINNCSYVRISLDAATTPTHRVIHAPSNQREDVFRRIVRNIEALVKIRDRMKKDVTIGIGYLVSLYNYKEIAKAARLVNNLGVDYIQIRPAFMPGKQLPKEVRAETEKLIQEAIKLSNHSFHVFPILHRFDEVINLDRAYDRCLGHALVGVVAANAKMYICCQLRGIDGFCIGDLRKQSFSQIWKGKKRKAVIRKINLNYCPPCRYNKYNELLDYLANKERPHKNFL
ncbi:MAG: radical SAM protein [Candidatus Omnitrophica bacterium]|nr:radical SAM protein [Candidatus Omnitrophota bacterium]MDD5591972.1 radical SAM protein [Candidatus Omnitrophota bacterium]